VLQAQLAQQEQLLRALLALQEVPALQEQPDLLDLLGQQALLEQPELHLKE
jgi:hypothetical protein